MLSFVKERLLGVLNQKTEQIKKEIEKLHKLSLAPVQVKDTTDQELSIEVRRMNFLKDVIALIRMHGTDEETRKALERVESEYIRIITGINADLEKSSERLEKRANSMIVPSSSDKQSLPIEKFIEDNTKMYCEDDRKTFKSTIRKSLSTQEPIKYSNLIKTIDSSLSPYNEADARGRPIAAKIQELNNLEASIIDLLKNIDQRTLEAIENHTRLLNRDLESEQDEIKNLLEERQAKIESAIVNIKFLQVGDKKYNIDILNICAKFVHASISSRCGTLDITLAMQYSLGQDTPNESIGAISTLMSSVSRAVSSRYAKDKLLNLAPVEISILSPVEMLSIYLEKIELGSKKRYQGKTISAQKLKEYLDLSDKKTLDPIIAGIAILANKIIKSQKLRVEKEALSLEEDLADAKKSWEIIEKTMRRYINLSPNGKAEIVLYRHEERKTELRECKKALDLLDSSSDTIDILSKKCENMEQAMLQRGQEYPEIIAKKLGNLKNKRDDCKLHKNYLHMYIKFLEIDVGHGPDEGLAGPINELNRILTRAKERFGDLKGLHEKSAIETMEGTISGLVQAAPNLYKEMRVKLEKMKELFNGFPWSEGDDVERELRQILCQSCEEGCQDCIKRYEKKVEMIKIISQSYKERCQDCIKNYEEEVEKITEAIKELTPLFKNRASSTSFGQAEKALKSCEVTQLQEQKPETQAPQKKKKAKKKPSAHLANVDAEQMGAEEKAQAL